MSTAKTTDQGLSTMDLAGLLAAGALQPATRLQAAITLVGLAFSVEHAQHECTHHEAALAHVPELAHEQANVVGHDLPTLSPADFAREVVALDVADLLQAGGSRFELARRVVGELLIGQGNHAAQPARPAEEGQD